MEKKNFSQRFIRTRIDEQNVIEKSSGRSSFLAFRNCFSHSMIQNESDRSYGRKRCLKRVGKC